MSEEQKTMTITVKMPKGTKDLTAVLREPLFDEYRMASMALQTNSGTIDTLKAGSMLVALCWVSGDEKLKNAEKSKDPDIHKAYAAVCMDAYNELFVAYDTEVKKN